MIELKDINRFCKLVELINELNRELENKRFNFYDGGHSFEECYSLEIYKLNEYQQEFQNILKK